MTAWKLFEGPHAYVSTPAFHAHRERAPHVDQPHHRPRLEKAAQFVMEAARRHQMASLSDLGCGDGGLLSLIAGRIPAWGYDFQPSNAAGWVERGVKAMLLDVFGHDRDRVKFGTITSVTEVLEHLTDPEKALSWIRLKSQFVVASSPFVENAENHDECHAWAFDPPGYAALFESVGFKIHAHEPVGPFQVILGEAW